MSNYENSKPVPDNAPSNSTLFYNALVQGLLRPEVRYGDAHYLDLVLPPDGEYVGATGRMSDYEDYKLQAASDLIRQRTEEWGAAWTLENNLPFPPQSLLPAERRSFLERGLAYIDIQLSEGPEPPDRYTANYEVVRPQDLPGGHEVVERAEAAGLNPASSEPYVFETGTPRYIPNPFKEPHLLALYKYLQTEQA